MARLRRRRGIEATSQSEKNLNDRANHPRLSAVKQGTVISFKEHGVKVGATVVSVDSCSKRSSKGESLKILKLRPQPGITLCQDHIYSSHPFEILKNTKPQKASSKSSPVKNTVPKAQDIKPGDRVTSDKYGDSIILIVVGVETTRRQKATVGCWKGQPVVTLIVRPENPSADVEDGASTNTGDEGTWLETGKLDQESTRANDTNRDSRESDDVSPVVVEEVGKPNEENTTPQDAMSTYPDDMLAIRFGNSKDSKWHFGNGSTVYNEIGSNDSPEYLNGNIRVLPTTRTATIKGATGLHPGDENYQKKQDPREYYELGTEDAEGASVGSPTALFTLLEVSTGRLGHRLNKIIKRSTLWLIRMQRICSKCILLHLEVTQEQMSS
ncbi:MAG: hypothetical protein ACPG4S_07885 [Schleiferiaceae bacterium]